MPFFKEIMIHHAKNKKGEVHNLEEIRNYHLGYKDVKNCVPLTEEQAREKLIAGTPGISKPWKECGFHWAITPVRYSAEADANDHYEILMCRPMTMAASACRQDEKNRTAIHILVVGDFDELPPNREQLDAVAKLCKYLMKNYKIPLSGIISHNSVVLEKSCPGTSFNMDILKTLIMQ